LTGRAVPPTVKHRSADHTLTTYFKETKMKTRDVLASLLAVALLALLIGTVRAEDAKEVTLSGNLACGKCTLKLTTECQNILQVKDGDKTTDYYLAANDVSKKYHKNICDAGTKTAVKITGTVAEKDGKMWLTATKIEEVKM
jgi:type 1 fimbria pilin